MRKTDICEYNRLFYNGDAEINIKYHIITIVLNKVCNLSVKIVMIIGAL